MRIHSWFFLLIFKMQSKYLHLWSVILQTVCFVGCNQQYEDVIPPNSVPPFGLVPHMSPPVIQPAQPSVNVSQLAMRWFLCKMFKFLHFNNFMKNKENLFSIYILVFSLQVPLVGSNPFKNMHYLLGVSRMICLMGDFWKGFPCILSMNKRLNFQRFWQVFKVWVIPFWMLYVAKLNVQDRETRA